VSSTTDLVIKARFLRNASPKAYDDFCKAFEVYVDAATMALIMATEDIHLHQGYVRQCLTLVNVFEEAKNG
jgi:hypothetical protein